MTTDLTLARAMLLRVLTARITTHQHLRKDICWVDDLEGMLNRPNTISRAGVHYLPGYYYPEVIQPGLDIVPWVEVRPTRKECFMSLTPRTYSYGNKGTGDQEYHSVEFVPEIRRLMIVLNTELGAEFNVCFLNYYEDEKNHLGWHADDFVGMREDQPIAVVSFGAEREIWVKPKKVPCWVCVEHPGAVCPACKGSGQLINKGTIPPDQRFLLQNGSLFIMPAGYQDTHLHRIPKHDRPCGPRISLTFRSFK